MADKQNIVLDGLGSLEAGTNSGLEPHLLQTNQTHFSTNVTYRGGYAGPRPPFRKINLTFVATPPITNGFAVELEKLFDDRLSEPAGSVIEISSTFAGYVVQETTLSPTGAPSTITLSAPFSGAPGDFIIIYNFENATPHVLASGQVTVVAGNDITIIPSAGPFNGVHVPYGVQVGISTLTQPIILGKTLEPFIVPPNNGDVVTVIVDNDQTAQIGTVVQVSARLYPAQYRILSSAPAPPIPQPQPEDFIHTLFQGATYYKPLAGVEYLIASIGGRFFTFTPDDLGNASVQLFPAMTQSPLVLQAWLWQAEQFVIWNDGQNLPVFWDGFVLSRSRGNGTVVVGTVVGEFTLFSNTTTILTLQSPYGGTAGDVLGISGTSVTFPVTAIGGNTITVGPANLTSLGGPNVTSWGFADGGQQLFNTASPGFDLNPQLPVGRMGAYIFGRNWVSLPNGFDFIASDVVGSSGGTAAYNYKDAVLAVTTNALLLGGSTFSIAGNVAPITAIAAAITLDMSLGQGPVQIFTNFGAFSCRAPIDPAEWFNLRQPILTQSLTDGGATGQNSTTSLNSDLMIRSAVPTNGIRSLKLARQDFTTSWGNVSQSREVDKVLALDNTSLLQYSTSISFSNRLLMSCLPSNGDLGIYHQGLIGLNADPVSSLRGKSPSIYDGFWTGLNIFQMKDGMFNKKHRAFAFCFNAFTEELELWEILADSEESFDNLTNPITWQFESAALFNNIKNKGRFDQIELLDGEIYLRDIRGIVNVQTWYKPDYSECWTPWHDFTVCAQNMPLTDPKQFRTRLGLGQPDSTVCEPTNNRPYRIGNTFQFRIQITGSCKFMGALFKGNMFPNTEFSVPVCDPLCDTSEAPGCEPCKVQTPCQTFPLVFYNLNAGKSYSNALLEFNVLCPNGSTEQVFIQAGTINFILPFPPGYTGEYPPLVLACVGGNIVRNVPTGSTQEQIDAIVAEMIQTCAEATAQANANCTPGGFTNVAVFFNHPCEGGTLTLTGTIPSWITVDTENSRLVGAAGTFTSASTAQANIEAQAALDTFGNAALVGGTLTCESGCVFNQALLVNRYQIQGYTDGMIANPFGAVPAGEPVWDGVFNLFYDFGDPLFGWAAGENLTYQADGAILCNALIDWNECTGETPNWQIRFGDGGDAWRGQKVGGNTPEGVYTQTGGADAGPATLTIEAAAGVATQVAGTIVCTS